MQRVMLCLLLMVPSLFFLSEGCLRKHLEGHSVLHFLFGCCRSSWPTFARGFLPVELITCECVFLLRGLVINGALDLNIMLLVGFAAMCIYAQVLNVGKHVALALLWFYPSSK